MDVVRESVSRLRGSVTVEPGAAGGARFVLRLPLTVAVVPAVIFEAGDHLLALPVMDVEDALRAPAPQRAGTTWVVRHRGKLLPLIHTRSLFPTSGSQEVSTEVATPFALLVRRGSRTIAITAERLLDQRGVVVKALPRYLGRTEMVSGASVAPDGRVLLVLDAADLIEMNLHSHRRAS